MPKKKRLSGVKFGKKKRKEFDEAVAIEELKARYLGNDSYELGGKGIFTAEELLRARKRHEESLG